MLKRKIFAFYRTILWKISSRGKYLKYLVSLLIFIVSCLYLYFLIKNGNLENKVLIDNTRYFLSAAAQSLAGLVAIVLVIYNLFSSRIPNYELIFRQHYPTFLERYHESKNIRKLIVISGITIFLLLISVIFIFDNIYSLFLLIILNLFFLEYSLMEFVIFISNALIIAGKDKFFEDCRYLLSGKVDYDTLVDIRNNLEQFNNEIYSEKYSGILIDKENLNSLFKFIILGFGKQLKDDERLGDSAYYRSFEDSLEYGFSESEIYDIWQSTFLEINPNFKLHIDMCIKNGHCIKYIPEVINLIIKMLDGFDRTSRQHLYEYYLKTYVEIINKVNGIIDQRINLKFYGLSKIRESVAKNGLVYSDFFIKLLSDLKLDKKSKIGQLKELLKDYENYYGDAKTEKEFKEISKELKANKHNELIDAQRSLNDVITKIKELNKKVS